MVQIVNQTDEEKMKMYMKLSKRELILMLIESNKHHSQPSWYQPKSIPCGYDPITSCDTTTTEDVQFTWTN